MAMTDGVVEPLHRDALARLLSPADPSDFLDKTRTGDVLLLEPSRHPRIDVDLAEVDRALETIRVTPGRVRVVNDGRPVADLALCEPVSPGDVAPGGHDAYLRLNAPALEAALAGGGTLIVNSVDELLPEVDEALRCLERALGSYQGFANLYATWGSARGFDLHVDDHDTCIVQVSGAKQWYLMSRNADVAALQGCSVDEIRESRHLEHVVDVRVGALLYVPRGVPHFALPLDDHSVHITLSYRRPVVADFLRWLLMQPEASSLTTTLVHPDGRPDLAASLVSALSPGGEGELVRRFFAGVAESSRSRPSLRLFSTTTTKR